MRIIFENVATLNAKEKSTCLRSAGIYENYCTQLYTIFLNVPEETLGVL